MAGVRVVHLLDTDRGGLTLCGQPPAYLTGAKTLVLCGECSRLAVADPRCPECGAAEGDLCRIAVELRPDGESCPRALPEGPAA